MIKIPQNIVKLLSSKFENGKKFKAQKAQYVGVHGYGAEVCGSDDANGSGDNHQTLTLPLTVYLLPFVSQNREVSETF